MLNLQKQKHMNM